MPNGYVSQIQINGGDVQNIGSCAYAVCDTAEDVSVKVVTLPGFVLKDGATIHVKFMYRNIAFNPKLNVNGTGGKTILLNTNSGFDSSLNLSSQYNVDQLWMAGAVVTLTYDGTYWVVNNPSRITSPYTYNLSAGNTIEPDSYMILADIEWELCNSSSSATARVFPFKVCMSTMVDGLYRDRSAIMEVFVGGSYNKKDYVDIMIHDESEYHVNDDYVFDSLVDSIFIYFEYEVSSSNVISKRTGHLLGKVPSRWSSFQLVPLTNGSVSSANPDEDHHFLKLDIAHSASSFVPSETSQTSIPSGNILPTTVGVHRYLIKARMKPFDVEQISGVLPISKGGTGATTAIGAEYNILNQVADIDTTLNDDRKIALCNQTKSSSNGVFRWIKLSNVWNWIKTKFDTTPTANSTNPVTSGGIKTALDAKQPTISVTTNTSTPADNDTIIMQASGTTNTTTFLRRTMSKIWDYIKSKADEVYALWNGPVNTPGCLRSQYQLYDWRLHDYFYALDKRITSTPISWKTYDSETNELIADYSSSVNKLFDGNITTYDTGHPVEGQYDVIYITSSATFTTFAGKLYLGFYHKYVPEVDPVVRIKRGNDNAWVTLTPTKYLLTLSADRDGNCYYLYTGSPELTVTDIEITIQGRADRAVYLSNVCFFKYRCNTEHYSAVTKHAVDQNLYGNVIAPKFTVRGGTSQQVLLANGTTINMPSTTGTNKDTLLKNLVSGLSSGASNVTDTTEIVTSYAGANANGFSTTDHVNQPYKRPATTFWNYIKGKADAVYATIASLASYYTKSEVDTALDGKKNLFTLTNSWIGQNVVGITYGVACRFKLTSVSEARTIYMRINARGVIHNLKILASSSSLAIGDQQVGNNANDDGVYGHLDTSTGIVTIYLKMRDYREGASVTEFNPANYYYYNNRLTDVTFPNKESVNTLPEGYVTASQDGWARYDKNGNDISTYYQPKLTLPLSVTNGGTGASDTKTARLNLLSDATEAATDASDGNFFAFRYQTPSSDNGAIYYRTADKVWNWIIGKITAGTGLSKSGNTINHSNSVTAQTSGLGSSVRIPAIKYDAQGHITYGTYYSVFSSEQYSAVKCGYISNGTNGAGWYKIADITYWGAAYTKYDVIISVVGTGVNAHDVGLLRIRGINAATAGVITGVNMGWIYKTPGTSNGFATNCIRATKTETNSSSGATLSLFIYIPVNDVSYNFLVLNEGLGGTSIRGHKLTFVNSTTKQTTEPAPTYATNFLPLEIGNQSNCLEITDSNWQSYLTASIAGGAVPSNIANGDILTIPEGVSQVFFNTTNEASIALVRGASTLNRFPRNGVRITIAGNWKPQENGGYSGSNAVGRFSAYLYVYRGGVASSSANYRMTHAFEDFMYFNGVWYSKGY